MTYLSSQTPYTVSFQCHEEISSIAMDEAGDQLAAGVRAEGWIGIWNVKSGVLLGSCLQNVGIRSMKFLSGERVLGVFDKSGMLKIWDTMTYEEIYSAPYYEETNQSVRENISQNGSRILVGNMEEESRWFSFLPRISLLGYEFGSRWQTYVELWQLQPKKRVAVITLPYEWIAAIALSTDNAVGAVGHYYDVTLLKIEDTDTVSPVEFIPGQ